MLFFVSLLVDGLLAGPLYALIALAFVVVYKTSRMVNFALGEWAMLGARLVATGLHALGLGLAGAIGLAGAAMAAGAVVFNRLVLRRLVGRPMISVIMVTLALGMLMRGATTLVLGGIPGAIPSPFPSDPLIAGGVPLSPEKLATAATATACVAVVSWFFRRSRTGLALRAIADDQQIAMAMGIDIDRHLSIAWAMMATISVLAGTLWIFVAGSGFGVVLVGLKVFPIVIVGGLDSIPGTVVAALAIGVLESLAAGYLDPVVGGGFSSVASYLALIAMLFARPYGMFGRPAVERI
ncbi:MAG: branched-chain amino acid ABC transporter permease [Candidatus Rokuibacteriota bacterium]